MLYHLGRRRRALYIGGGFNPRGMMNMSTSNTILAVRLPSGHRAVYELQPQHMNLQHWGASLNQVAIECGRQLAHEYKGAWYEPAGWHPIADPRTIELLERVTQAEASSRLTCAGHPGTEVPAGQEDEARHTERMMP